MVRDTKHKQTRIYSPEELSDYSPLWKHKIPIKLIFSGFIDNFPRGRDDSDATSGQVSGIQTDKGVFVQTANLLPDSRPCEMMSMKCENNDLTRYIRTCECQKGTKTPEELQDRTG